MAPGSGRAAFCGDRAPSTVSYTGVVEVVRIGSHSAEASVYRVEHRAPDLTRRIYSAPSALSGDSVDFEGRPELLDRRSAPSHRRDAQRRARRPRSRSTTITRCCAKTIASFAKATKAFDGRSTVDLMLVNKYNHQPAMLVRIDRESKIVLD